MNCRIRTNDSTTVCKEIDNTIEEVSSDGGPLSSVLSLIRVIFIPQTQRYSQERHKRSTLDSEFLEDCILLSSCLVRTFAQMPEDHPDFLYSTTRLYKQ